MADYSRELLIKLGLDTKPFTKGLKDSSKALSSLANIEIGKFTGASQAIKFVDSLNKRVKALKNTVETGGGLDIIGKANLKTLKADAREAFRAVKVLNKAELGDFTEDAEQLEAQLKAILKVLSSFSSKKTAGIEDIQEELNELNYVLGVSEDKVAKFDKALNNVGTSSNVKGYINSIEKLVGVYNKSIAKLGKNPNKSKAGKKAASALSAAYSEYEAAQANLNKSDLDRFGLDIYGLDSSILKVEELLSDFTTLKSAIKTTDVSGLVKPAIVDVESQLAYFKNLEEAANTTPKLLDANAALTNLGVTAEYASKIFSYFYGHMARGRQVTEHFREFIRGLAHDVLNLASVVGDFGFLDDTPKAIEAAIAEWSLVDDALNQYNTLDRSNATNVGLYGKAMRKVSAQLHSSAASIQEFTASASASLAIDELGEDTVNEYNRLREVQEAYRQLPRYVNAYKDSVKTAYKVVENTSKSDLSGVSGTTNKYTKLQKKLKATTQIGEALNEVLLKTNESVPVGYEAFHNSLKQVISTTKENVGSGLRIDFDNLTDEQYLQWLNNVNKGIEALESNVNDVSSLSMAGTSQEKIAVEAPSADVTVEEVHIDAGKVSLGDITGSATKIAEDLKECFSGIKELVLSDINEFDGVSFDFTSETEDLQKLSGTVDMLTKSLQKMRATRANNEQKGIIDSMVGDSGMLTRAKTQINMLMKYLTNALDNGLDEDSLLSISSIAATIHRNFRDAASKAQQLPLAKGVRSVQLPQSQPAVKKEEISPTGAAIALGREKTLVDKEREEILKLEVDADTSKAEEKVEKLVHNTDEQRLAVTVDGAVNVDTTDFDALVDAAQKSSINAARPISSIGDSLKNVHAIIRQIVDTTEQNSILPKAFAATSDETRAYVKDVRMALGDVVGDYKKLAAIELNGVLDKPFDEAYDDISKAYGLLEKFNNSLDTLFTKVFSAPKGLDIRQGVLKQLKSNTTDIVNSSNDFGGNLSGIKQMFQSTAVSPEYTSSVEAATDAQEDFVDMLNQTVLALKAQQLASNTDLRYLTQGQTASGQYGLFGEAFENYSAISEMVEELSQEASPLGDHKHEARMKTLNSAAQELLDTLLMIKSTYASLTDRAAEVGTVENTNASKFIDAAISNVKNLISVSAKDLESPAQNATYYAQKRFSVIAEASRNVTKNIQAANRSTSRFNAELTAIGTTGSDAFRSIAQAALEETQAVKTTEEKIEPIEVPVKLSVFEEIRQALGAAIKQIRDDATEGTMVDISARIGDVEQLDSIQQKLRDTDNILKQLGNSASQIALSGDASAQSSVLDIKAQTQSAYASMQGLYNEVVELYTVLGDSADMAFFTELLSRISNATAKLVAMNDALNEASVKTNKRAPGLFTDLAKDANSATKQLSNIPKEINRLQSAAKKADFRKALGLTEAEAELLNAKNILSSISDTLKIIGGSAVFLAVSRGIGNMVNKLQQAFSYMQQFNQQIEYSRLAFANLTSDQEQSNRLMEVLANYSATTPISFEQATAAAKSFMAYGMKAENVMYALQGVTAAASVGGMDEQTIEALSRALGQIYTKGTLRSEEIMQLAEAGIPAIEILEDKLGLTEDEINNIGKASIDSGKALNALIEGMNERYSAMVAAAMTTTDGLLSNIKDNMSYVGGALIEPISQQYRTALKIVSDLLVELRDIVQAEGIGGLFEKLIPESIQNAIREVTANLRFLAKVIGSIMTSGFTGFINMLASAFNFLAPIIQGVAFAIYGFIKWMKSFSEAGTQVTSVIGTLVGMFVLLNTVQAANALITVAKNLPAFKMLGVALKATASFIAIAKTAFASLTAEAKIVVIAIMAIVTALAFLAGSSIGKSIAETFNNLKENVMDFFGISPDSEFQKQFNDIESDLNEFNNQFKETEGNIEDGAEDAKDAVDDLAKGLLSFDEVFKLNEDDDTDASSDAIDLGNLTGMSLGGIDDINTEPFANWFLEGFDLDFGDMAVKLAKVASAIAGVTLALKALGGGDILMGLGRVFKALTNLTDGTWTIALGLGMIAASGLAQAIIDWYNGENDGPLSKEFWMEVDLRLALAGGVVATMGRTVAKALADGLTATNIQKFASASLGDKFKMITTSNGFKLASTFALAISLAVSIGEILNEIKTNDLDGVFQEIAQMLAAGGIAAAVGIGTGNPYIAFTVYVAVKAVLDAIEWDTTEDFRQKVSEGYDYMANSISEMYENGEYTSVHEGIDLETIMSGLINTGSTTRHGYFSNFANAWGVSASSAIDSVEENIKSIAAGLGITQDEAAKALAAVRGTDVSYNEIFKIIDGWNMDGTLYRVGDFSVFEDLTETGWAQLYELLSADSSGKADQYLMKFNALYQEYNDGATYIAGMTVENLNEAVSQLNKTGKLSNRLITKLSRSNKKVWQQLYDSIDTDIGKSYLEALSKSLSAESSDISNFAAEYASYGVTIAEVSEEMQKYQSQIGGSYVAMSETVTETGSTVAEIFDAMQLPEVDFDKLRDYFRELGFDTADIDEFERLWNQIAEKMESAKQTAVTSAEKTAAEAGYIAPAVQTELDKILSLADIDWDILTNYLKELGFSDEEIQTFQGMINTLVEATGKVVEDTSTAVQQNAKDMDTAISNAGLSFDDAETTLDNLDTTSMEFASSAAEKLVKIITNPFEVIANAFGSLGNIFSSFFNSFKTQDYASAAGSALGSIGVDSSKVQSALTAKKEQNTKTQELAVTTSSAKMAAKAENKAIEIDLSELSKSNKFKIKTAAHATGGVFNREHYALLNEGNKSEAVIPLENNSAMQPFVDAVAQGLSSYLGPVLSSMQSSTTGNTYNNELQPIYVGNLIADDRSLRELERRMNVIRLQENRRS